MKKLILLFISIVILWKLGAIDNALNKYYEYKYRKNTSNTIEFQKDESIPIMVDTSNSNINMPTIKIKQYLPNKEKLDHISIPHIKPVHKKIQSKKKYRCDGRTWCSQMTSCEEATFFSHHCSNTMDGDGDGITL